MAEFWSGAVSGGRTLFVSWMACVARPSCFRLLPHFIRFAASRTFCTAGSSKPIRMAMIAMTTSSSIRVNACRGDIFREGMVATSFRQSPGLDRAPRITPRARILTRSAVLWPWDPCYGAQLANGSRAVKRLSAHAQGIDLGHFVVAQHAIPQPEVVEAALPVARATAPGVRLHARVVGLDTDAQRHHRRSAQ